MSTLDCTEPTIRAKRIQVNNDRLTVELIDGRTLSVPLEWYPRLFHGEPEERNEFQLIANGCGIHWPKLDEDISIQNLLEGRRSKSSSSLDRRNGFLLTDFIFHESRRPVKKRPMPLNSNRSFARATDAA